MSFPVNTGVRYANNSLVFAKPVSSVYAYSITNSYSDSGNYTLTLEDIQLESGTTVHGFEPYQGQTYSVDWQTDAGTVYKGTVDPVYLTLSWIATVIVALLGIAVFNKVERSFMDTV